MVHSIELLLDERADAAVRRIASHRNRPHITLVAAERIAPDIDHALSGLAGDFPLSAVLGAPLVFGRDRLTLARLVVPSGGLLALHQKVYDLCQPFVPNVFAHCAPGEWTPHVTLGRRFTPAQIGEALAVDGITADIAASIVGLRRWDGDAKREYLIS
jgi:2'-5' RNA ligase